MTSPVAPMSILAPPDYRSYFTLSEFKFRWLEALMLVNQKWCRGAEIFTASILVHFMDQQGLCFPSVDKLAKSMRKSPDSVRRSLRELANNGWLVIQNRSNKTNLFQALLPDFGLQALTESRRQKIEPSPMIAHREIVNRVLEDVCRHHGFDLKKLAVFPEHSRLVGKLFQVVQRMPGGEHQVERLIDMMCEEPPPTIKSPHGFLMARATEFARGYGATGKKRTEQVPAMPEAMEVAVKTIAALQEERLHRK